MMQIKTGCDIVEIKRFSTLDKRTLQKLFHKTELKKLKPETLAGLFAAKESCKKVFHDLDWLDIEIKRGKNQKPILLLSRAENILSSDVSISHDGRYAMAMVVFLMEK